MAGTCPSCRGWDAVVLDGLNLDEHVREHPLAARDAALLVASIAAAIQHPVAGFPEAPFGLKGQREFLGEGFYFFADLCEGGGVFVGC